MSRLLDLINTNQPLIADGAMGTYYALLTGAEAAQCERANLTAPDIIREIHRRYIQAGARLLRTNTFAANAVSLGGSLEEVRENIRHAYAIAAECAGEQAIVAADIGPIYTDSGDELEEYLAIIDTFLECGADTFLFETFADADMVRACARAIREKNPEAAIIASFTFSADGYSRKGISAAALVADACSIPEVDILGFNCGIGPMHMMRLVEKIGNPGKPLSVMPNAGYPTIENQRTIFSSSPEYFASIVHNAVQFGAKILGGCCGTTPEHIAALSATQVKGEPIHTLPARVLQPDAPDSPPKSRFNEKLEKGEFVMIAELDPPYSSNIDKLLNAARRYQALPLDAVTVSDSPMARAKIDPVVCAAKIRRTTGMETIPHLCCRDRNVNALRAAVLAAHCEGIRSVLAVTGDPISEIDRGFVKPVFNVYSSKLMRLIQDMNGELFGGSPFTIAGALNVAALNQEAELERVVKKQKNGAGYLLSQPVFDLRLIEFIERVRKTGIKVLVGVLPIVSYRNAAYLNNEVPGMHIPASVLSQFSPAMPKEQAVETGIQIAADLARQLRPHADGFYFITPFNRAEIICELVRRIRADRDTDFIPD